MGQSQAFFWNCLELKVVFYSQAAAEHGKKVHDLPISRSVSSVFCLYSRGPCSSISVSAHSFQGQSGRQGLFAFKLAFGSLASDNKLNILEREKLIQEIRFSAFIWDVFSDDLGPVLSGLGLFNCIILFF